MNKHLSATKAVIAMALLLVCFCKVAAVEYNLTADTVNKAMPDGKNVTMWGFGLNGSPASVPGPQLSVPENDTTLTIFLTNNLSVPISLIIPGQTTAVKFVKHGTDSPYANRIRSFTKETAPGETVTYVWKNVRPGTFIYHSATHPAIQVQMGLYGAMTKKVDATHAYADNNNALTAAFDSEIVVLYSEIDPDLHDAVVSGNYGPEKTVTSPIGYRPQYFLVNGQAYDSASPPAAIVAGTTGGKILIRFLNAGFKSHAPMIKNHWMKVVAEDGFPFTYPRERCSLTVEALKTKDVIISPDTAGTYPLFDRSLHLTNGKKAGGGMLTYLQITD